MTLPQPDNDADDEDNDDSDDNDDNDPDDVDDDDYNDDSDDNDVNDPDDDDDETWQSLGREQREDFEPGEGRPAERFALPNFILQMTYLVIIIIVYLLF